MNMLGWITSISFIAVTFIPRFLDNIMFVDGMIYAAISRNMAMGNGTFWQPQFMKTVWPSYNNCSFFCDHPPIMFMMESVLFRFFPDQTIVENVYNLLILIVLVGLIELLWRKFFENRADIIAYSWLPVLCWYAIRTVWWSVPNNLLDTSMAVFCLLSCLFQLYALSESDVKKSIGYWFLSGSSLLLAFLTKGPIGLYPFAFVAIFALIHGRSKYFISLKGSLMMVAVFAVEMLLLMSYEPAFTFITQYFDGQVVQSLLQKRENLGNSWESHFFLIKMLKKDLLPHFVGLIGLYGLSYLVGNIPRPSISSRKVCLISLIVALSGILPILISKKQGASYMMPALPFIGIFFAAAYVEIVMVLSNKYQFFTKLVLVSITVMCWFATVYTFNHSEQHYLKFSLDEIGKYVPRGKELGVSKAFYHDSYVPAYFQRYHELSPTTDWEKMEYILADTTCSDQIKLLTNHKVIWRDRAGLFSLYKKSEEVQFNPIAR